MLGQVEHGGDGRHGEEQEDDGPEDELFRRRKHIYRERDLDLVLLQAQPAGETLWGGGGLGGLSSVLVLHGFFVLGFGNWDLWWQRCLQCSV